jgi:hypothetical protein
MSAENDYNDDYCKMMIQGNQKTERQKARSQVK